MAIDSAMWLPYVTYAQFRVQTQPLIRSRSRSNEQKSSEPNMMSCTRILTPDGAYVCCWLSLLRSFFDAKVRSDTRASNAAWLEADNRRVLVTSESLQANDKLIHFCASTKRLGGEECGFAQTHC